MEDKQVTFINSWGIPVINYPSPNQGRRAQHPRRGRRAPGRPRQGRRAPGATTTSRCPGTRAWKARRRRAPPGTQSPKVGSGESLKSVFNNPMVGTIYSLVSSDVTNLQSTSGSGNLSPTLGEEVCAPLWCKISVLLSLLNLSSAAKSW